jgi:hypothetical protein
MTSRRTPTQGLQELQPSAVNPKDGASKTHPNGSAALMQCSWLRISRIKKFAFPFYVP